MEKITMHQRFITLLLVITVLGAVYAPAIAAETLRVGEMFEIDSLDPAQGGTFVKEKALIAETLVEPDPDFTLVPGLAESWTMVSDTVWEFRLRKGVCFHNGAALTARMAADSITRALTINPAIAGITRIKDVAATGEQTLQIRTDGRFMALPAALVYADLAIVHPESETNDQGIIIHPIGTGPYQLVAWKRAEQTVRLTRNETYWGPKPKIARIEFRAIPDPATRSLAIQKGSIDLVPDAPYGDLELLRKKGLSVTIANAARVYQISFGSLTGTPFADVRVRRALSLAINREDIVRYVLFGMGKPAAGPYEKNMIFANKDLNAPVFDPEKANALLTEAGWVDADKRGVRRKDGRPLALTLYTHPQRPGQKPMAMAIVQQWMAVGVKADVRVMNWSAIGMEMKPGDARLGANATAMIPDPDYYLRRLYARTSPDNQWGYVNQTVEDLLSQGIREKDPARRLETYKKIQALVVEDQPLIHVSYYGVNIITSPKVNGFVFNPVCHDYMLNTQMTLEK
ncbi:peptide ABC transporter substrate-binding protein [Desulfosarcina ovata subsp. sediminis]|uniref:Peptide ABC transporter substrate-binding protein n=2 Tax=Desulfosarcina ovata TaxID=83564 RepID=A0A5K7ZQW4_9BACT|nr:peptide ABC transporter substrate-binding protein [Desulfosarcina ovata subsp. sediminis]